jgi:hypothetical protein
MCAAPSHRFALHRRRRGSCAPLLLIASRCIVAGAGHRHLRCRLVHQRGEFGRVEVLIDTADQGLRTRGDPQLNHDADSQGDQCAVAAGGVQDVLLDETVGEQLAVEDFVAASRGDPDEPVQMSSSKSRSSVASSLRSIAANGRSATSAMTC